MVKKLKKMSEEKKKSGNELPRAIKESAQQIWLAGLGAFAKAQEEGSKVFESLVNEGLTMQRKTQAAAEEKITEATSRVTGMANDIGSRAAGQWDKLETIFEDRVAKAMSRLGVPTARDLDVINARIDALAKSLGKTLPDSDDAAAPTTAKAASKAAPKKVAVKEATVKKPAAKKAAAAEAAPSTDEASAAPAPAAKKPAAKKPAAKKAAASRPPFPQVAPRSVEDEAAEPAQG